MSTMTLDGYVAVVTLDEDADVFHGEVVNTRDVLTFQGRSPEELRQAFRDTLDDYFAWCRERGKTPDRPYSGTLSLRIGPELHRRAALAAARRGRTLNAFIKDQIEKVAAEP
ncbi:MAG TPA: type II toxin-antitoxin system HicB family antitoxin [Beijerinckiaceae bacterium]|nr:type II toxin-antitoxin system HicB family antitoxin [Beijerinckiaceae bacterium]